MAIGRKTGGRRAGTPNRKTQEISDLLASLGHNPIAAMVSIATNPKASLELQGRMNAELAQYVYSKRKAVEVTGDESSPPRHLTIQIVDTPEAPGMRETGTKTEQNRGSTP